MSFCSVSKFGAFEGFAHEITYHLHFSFRRCSCFVGAILFKRNGSILNIPSGPERSALYFKCVLFRAFESTYCTTVLPIIFIKVSHAQLRVVSNFFDCFSFQQEHLYYDFFQCGLLGFWVLTNLLSLLSTHMFSAHFVELSLQAQMQGGWAPLAPGTPTVSFCFRL